MVLCGLRMQQYAMHNATIQKTAFFELGVYQSDILISIISNQLKLSPNLSNQLKF